jgi:anti-sigma B factor antagonist
LVGRCKRLPSVTGGDVAVTHTGRILIYTVLPTRLDYLMPDSRLDIPGPRLGGGDESPALQVVVHQVTGAVAVAEVRGDLDTTTACAFDGWVREHWAGRDDLVLDLDGVGFLASAGIAVLMGLRLDAPGHGVRLHLAGRSNRAVRRPLEVLGLEAVLDLQADAGAVVAELTPSA